MDTTQESAEGAEVSEIGEEACLLLIGDAGVGRVGFVYDGEVFIYPVNYGRDGKSIAFRISDDSNLHKAIFSKVAFQVDGVDETRRIGWSVLVRGVAREMTEAIDELSERIKLSGIRPWAAGDKSTWIRLIDTEITGRRLFRA